MGTTNGELQLRKGYLSLEKPFNLHHFLMLADLRKRSYQVVILWARASSSRASSQTHRYRVRKAQMDMIRIPEAV